MRITLLILSLAFVVPCLASQHDRRAVEDRLVQFVSEARELLKKRQASLAERKIETAYAYLRTHLPDDPGWTSTLLSVMGDVMTAQGKAARAADFHVASTGHLLKLLPPRKYPLGHVLLVGSLHNSAIACSRANRKTEARKYSTLALNMAVNIFTKERFPDGHPKLAQRLNAHGTLMMEEGDLKSARGSLEKAVRMHRNFVGHKGGRRRLAIAESNLGRLEHLDGKLHDSAAHYRESERLWRELYPASSHPDGHPDLARLLGNRGSLENARGDFTRALAHHRQALKMYESYHRLRSPQGHLDIARSLHNTAVNLEQLGQLADAERQLVIAKSMFVRVLKKRLGHYDHNELAWCCATLARVRRRRGKIAAAAEDYFLSLKIRERLFPESRYPSGHVELARALDDVAMLTKTLKQFDRSLLYARRAAAMNRRLYPASEYADGHPELARSLNNLGTVLEAREEFSKAATCYRESLAMVQKLYARPGGGLPHEEIARAHANLGRVLRKTARPKLALPHLLAAVGQFQRLSRVFAGELSEAQALNFADNFPRIQSDLIDVWLKLRKSPQELYARIWQTRAARMRMLTRRTERLRASADPEVRKLLREYYHFRTALSSRYRPRDAVAQKSKTRIDARNHRLAMLQRNMERLESRIVSRLPNWRPENLADTTPPAKLKLSADTALVDFYRYHNGAGKPRFVAFVRLATGTTRMVDLGPTAPIQSAVRSWREILMRFKQNRRKPTLPYRETLGKLVWSPIARQLPDDTKLVYIVPEGSLWFVPWYALKGKRPGRFLIEELTIATAPSGPWLARYLSDRPKWSREESRLVSVGGVDYVELPTTRKADFAVKKRSWRKEDANRARFARPKKQGFLAGSVVESRYAAFCARKYPSLLLQGREASTRQVLTSLTRARWAVLATHGLYSSAAGTPQPGSDPASRPTVAKTRLAPDQRNPLLRSSLSFAGSSRLYLHRTRGGYATAQDIADLPLEKLETVFLSACQTALGDLETGEGVHGLPRAFHRAGARNVVSNLWSVDDRATMKIMMLAYRKLFEENKSPLQAVREAQLAMIHSPAALLGWDGTSPFRPPSSSRRQETTSSPGKRPGHHEQQAAEKVSPSVVHEFFWAPLVVSGIGR